MSQELTYGQRAVGIRFNPSEKSEVDEVRQEIANLIDRLHNKRSSTEDMEVIRMCSIAITELQSAQMWAVKALTW